LVYFMHEAEIRINLAVIAKNCNQGTASITSAYQY